MTKSDGDPRYQLPPRDTVITKARKRNKSAKRVAGEKGGLEFRSLAIPLEFYLATQSITEEQYRAGCRLAKLWFDSVHSPYMQVSYGERKDGAVVITHLPIGMFAVEYRKALMAVKGRNERRIVHAVCCEDKHASQSLSFSSARTGRRRGMEYLKAALDDLCGYFKTKK